MAWASAASGEYPVFVGRGVLALAGALPGLEGRSFCVTDSAVAEHHLGAALTASLSGLVEFPPGEEHKTLATAERVWHALVAQGVTRADHLIALGGGVVGDLAGFCAATFQRGIPIVQAPTTIVSQVDSAYGGKTGVDLPEAKNYVGAYHQPAAVLADTTTLATLPPEEHAAGYAEVVKTALIAGGPLWKTIAAGGAVTSPGTSSRNRSRHIWSASPRWLATAAAPCPARFRICAAGAAYCRHRPRLLPSNARSGRAKYRG